MSLDRGYKIRDQNAPHFVTFTVVKWVDVFTRSQYRDTFLGCIRHCQFKKGLKVHAWCIMSNHVHLILSVNDGRLSTVIRDLKKYSSYKIMREINENKSESRRNWMLNLFIDAAVKHSRNRNMQFWKHDNCPQELYSDKFIMQKVNYIHHNPVKALLVDDELDYIYSSARDYGGKQGLLEIEFI